MINAALSSLTEYSPSRGICLILAMGMVVWGFWVILPFQAFNAASWELMSHIAQEEAWGAVMLFGGVTLLGGVVTRDVEWIRTGAFLGFVLWTVVAVLGTIADPAATGLAVRMTLALMHAYMYMQVRLHKELITGEVKIEDLRNFVAQQHKEETTNV